MEDLIIEKLDKIIGMLSSTEVRTAVDDTNKDYVKRTTELLKQMGIPANLKGYEFVKRAILLVLEDPELIFIA